VNFEAGARTAWHTHPLGQTLIVISGRGLVQSEGGVVQEILPGDVVWIPANARHRHGAASNSPMSHVAISAPRNDLTVEWMEHVNDEQYRSYKTLLFTHILPVFGNLQLDGIQREDIKEFLNNKRKEKNKKTGKPLSINRIKRIKAVLLCIFTNAIDDNKVGLNPAAKLDKWLKPKDVPAEEPKDPFTAIELELYLNTVRKHHPRYYPFFLTLARTGMRLGEALALQWGDIDFNGRFLDIRRALVEGKGTTTKSGIARRVTASPQLLEVLAKLCYFPRYSAATGMKICRAI
jgi:integrase